MKRTVLYAATIGVLVALPGCRSRYQDFAAIGATGETVPTETYLIRDKDGGQRKALITVEALGRRSYHRGDALPEIDVLRIRLHVDNTSDLTLEIPLEEIVARDGFGRQLRPIHRAVPQDLATGRTRLTVPPYARISSEVGFEVGPEGALDDLESASVTWSYRLPTGAGNTHTSRFLPVHYDPVVYPAPVSVGFFYGPGFFCW